MKHLIFLLLCAITLPTSLSAQADPIQVFREVDSLYFKVKCFRRHKEFFTFQPGDNIAISFDESRGEGLPKIKLISPSEFVEPLWENAINLKKEDKIIPIIEAGRYTFEFNNRAWKLAIPRHRKCRFQVWLVDSIQPLQNFVVFDSVPTFQTIPQADTSIIPLLDDSIYISPRLNLTQPNRKAVQFILPKEVISWAYWIGVGEEAKSQYTQLTQAGILAQIPSPDPLYRLLKGKIISLPRNIYGDDLNYVFTDFQGQGEFMKLGAETVSYYSIASNSKVKADYGKQDKAWGQELGMFLCAENRSKISGITAYLKLMGVVVTPKDSIEVITSYSIQPKLVVEIPDSLSRSEKLAIMESFEESLAYAKELLLKKIGRELPSSENQQKLSQLIQVEGIIHFHERRVCLYSCIS